MFPLNPGSNKPVVNTNPERSSNQRHEDWSNDPISASKYDTAFIAPFVVQNNLKGLGLVDSLALWTFTDVFEEGRAGNTLFYGGFGLVNAQGLK